MSEVLFPGDGVGFEEGGFAFEGVLFSDCVADGTDGFENGGLWHIVRNRERLFTYNGLTVSSTAIAAAADGLMVLILIDLVLGASGFGGRLAKRL